MKTLSSLTIECLTEKIVKVDVFWSGACFRRETIKKQKDKKDWQENEKVFNFTFNTYFYT